MSALVRSALERLPHALRQRAGRAALLRAQGYTENEIANALGQTRRQLHRDSEALQRALLAAIADSGLTLRDVGLATSHVPSAATSAK